MKHILVINKNQSLELSLSSIFLEETEDTLRFISASNIQEAINILHLMSINLIIIDDDNALSTTHHIAKQIATKPLPIPLISLSQSKPSLKQRLLLNQPSLAIFEKESFNIIKFRNFVLARLHIKKISTPKKEISLS